MKKKIFSFCFAFLLIGNYLVNTDHISLISIKYKKYRIYFDTSNEYHPEQVYIDVLISDAPKLIEQLLLTNEKTDK